MKIPFLKYLKTNRNNLDDMKIDATILDPKCSICSKSAAKIEIVNPNGYPSDAKNWTQDDLKRYNKYRNFKAHYLVYTGPGGGNGASGDEISLERKERLIKLFSSPHQLNEIKKEFYDMAGGCIVCKKFYCNTHWNISASGYGKCPEGHGQSLDPHWSPDY